MPSDLGRILAAPWCAATMRKSGGSLPSATATYTAMRKAAAAGVRTSQQVPRGDDRPGSSPRRGPRNLVRRRSASAGRLVRHKASGEQQCKAPLEVGSLGAFITAQDIRRVPGKSACAGHGETQPPSVAAGTAGRVNVLHAMCCMQCGASTGCLNGALE